MNHILYGLWVEDTKTTGHNPIGYFDTMEELENKIVSLKEVISKMPTTKKIFMVEHDYNRKTDSIKNFNYDDRVYIENQ